MGAANLATPSADGLAVKTCLTPTASERPAAVLLFKLLSSDAALIFVLMADGLANAYMASSSGGGLAARILFVLLVASTPPSSVAKLATALIF
jgi:hypothetical protein